jgi:hypothetical protein
VRVLGWISLLIGVAALLFAGGLLLHNDDLATGGPALLPAIVYDSWRYLLGGAVLVGAVTLTVGWLAVRRLPALAWLALLVFAVALPLYLAVSLVASAALGAIALVVGGVLVPVGASAIASGIGVAVRRRQARRIGTVA